MTFGSKTLQRGDQGPDVIELQMRLAGFHGGVWDGDYGPGTELVVSTFQRDYMGMAKPTGVADATVFQALKKFAGDFPIDFEPLKCKCGECNGFGQGRFKGEYRDNHTGIERYYKYEYPGIHKAILHSFRAAQFYAEQAGLGRAFITCGYRCWVNNERKGRRSTNHMGKALDVDLPMQAGDDKEDDRNRCDMARAVFVDKCNFQIGWGSANKKALEPSHIAPSWVHMDVRCFRQEYLRDEYFVTSAAALDAIEVKTDAGAAFTPPSPPAALVPPAKAAIPGDGNNMAAVAAVLSSLNLP